MKIVCKMTTVLACCQTNRQKDREGGREEKEESRRREREEEAGKAAQCVPCVLLCQGKLTWEYTYKSFGNALDYRPQLTA